MIWKLSQRGSKLTARVIGRFASLTLLLLSVLPTYSQQVATNATSKLPAEAEMERLAQAVDQTQKALNESQHELEEVRTELVRLRAELASQNSGQLPSASRSSTVPGASSDTNIDEDAQGSSTTEQTAMQASQIATLDQVKVESESKYPLRLTGTLLLNGFANTGRVDDAASPTSALGGSGSTGLSVRQTVLGFDADGPRLFGAASHADLRVDFFGSAGGQYGNSVAGLVRFRTAHAGLEWTRTRLFFAQDRPIIVPNMPESLVAVAQPELAWSGNLWSWNPQAGISHTIGTKIRARFEAAFIDPADPSSATITDNTTASQSLASLAESSRRPGSEARIALLGSDDQHSAQFGVGGYFAPHTLVPDRTGIAKNFDAWAATLDYKLPLRRGFTLSGSAYRGQALGGLGGGGYKDYVYRGTGTSLAIRPLDDVGGWSQLHHDLNQQVSWNAGFGIDNAFSSELRAYPDAGAANVYGNLARNRTFFGNVIYSPSSYLKLSLEYRNLFTAPVSGLPWRSNSTGVGAAYRF